jgi:hypothetical protein
MKFDLKNILLGFVIGIISITSNFLLIGDLDIQTDFQFGEKSDKDIRISIEKNIDENDKEVIIVNAIGKGSVTIKDIESELEKVFTEQNIDASSGIEVNITLDDEIDFE